MNISQEVTSGAIQMNRNLIIFWVAGLLLCVSTATALSSVSAADLESNTSFTGWSGNVTLLADRTVEIPTINNVSTNITLDQRSVLGALDAAATAGGFDYTVREEEWGPFIYSIGNVQYDETSGDAWFFMVNNITADVGAADYLLQDGDRVTLWYGPENSTAETADYVVTFWASIPEWMPVTLTPGSFNITATNSGDEYTVDRLTPLGALDASGTPYTVDDSYYQEYGSLFIDSIQGRENEGASGWMYQVNDIVPPVGPNTYTLSDGDEVVFYWSGSMESTPASSDQVVPIRVSLG